MAAARVVVHAAVIGQGGKAGLLECRAFLSTFFARAAVDDSPRPCARRGNRAAGVARVGFFGKCGSGCWGGRSWTHEDARGAEVEALQDFGARRGVGGGGERDARHLRKGCSCSADRPSIPGEVVPHCDTHALRRFENSDTRASSSRLWKRGVSRRSGATYSSFVLTWWRNRVRPAWPLRHRGWSSETRRRCPALFSAATGSSISAMSGDTTTAQPSRTKPDLVALKRLCRRRCGHEHQRRHRPQGCR